MTITIAIAGKGGVGKTSIAALLMKYLIENKKGTVLAVDADPNSNLHEKIGIESEKTIGSMREEIIKSIDSFPIGISKSEHIQYKIRTLLKEGHGFDLLVMGRSEGPGCYCYVNNLLRVVLDLLAEKYPYVIIDNEAGMEHLSRRTTRNIDLLLILSDDSPIGRKTAERLRILSQEMDLKIKKTVLIINKSQIHEEKQPLHKFLGVYYLSEDEELNAYNLECKSLLKLPSNSKVYLELVKIMDGLIK